MNYRRCSSPLHASRAAAGMAYCGALALGSLVSDSPVVLVAILAGVVGAAVAAGVGREIRHAALLAVPLALLIAVINPLVAREGLTVIARFGEVGPLGQLDITLEAVVYGAVLGLRALVVILACALYAAAVDPDEVLRLFRRLSLRSALTATLATRMVPVLSRDARRMADAQRCRPGAPPGRTAVVRAVATNALDRAVDVAATLELRGYGVARRPPRERRRWSRHDLAFTASAIGLVGLVAVSRIYALAEFGAYPQLRIALGVEELLLAAAIIAVCWLPFLDRRGVARSRS
ncbi:MAG: energy-coupling factor transporter transmembrane component T [Solirubrobacterales bacterium]|nr:energy-coupling factor transporter transmembrane component T [Solirubrobacterales bacterium]